jgi:YD repeat-containing protein
VSYDEGTSYKIYTYSLQPNLEIETFYDPITQQELQEQRVNYSYNSKKLLSEISMLRSDGKKQVTKFVYPFEIKEGQDITVLRKMTEKHIFSDYVDKVTYSNDNVIEGEYRKYGETSTNSGIFRPERIDVLLSTGVIPYESLYSFINSYREVVSINLSVFTEATKERSFPYCNHTEMGYIALSGKGNIQIIKNDQDTVYSKAFSVILGEERENITLTPGQYKIILKRQQIMYSSSCRLFLQDRKTTIAGNGYLQPEMYYRYDNYGNIRESKSAGSNMPTVYLWGYKSQYPIAKIENATYEQVRTALGYSNDNQVETLSNNDTPFSFDWTTINNLRTQLPNAQVTVYQYKPLAGITLITDPRGVKTTYEYDSFGRLQAIKDTNNKAIESYEYHYKN